MLDIKGRAEAAIQHIWSDTELLECVAVRPEISNTANFVFRAPSGAVFDFDPGQYLVLELPTPSGTVHRTYTISSSPSRSHHIEITAKAQHDSIGTRWMLDHLKPGMRLKATGPSGTFTNARSDSAKFLFISAGSGITPMMSMTTFMLDQGYALDITFIHCARRPSELLFQRRLEQMANKAQGLDVKLVVSTSDGCEQWNGYRGRLNQEMLEEMVPDYLEREVYCCGPSSFMQFVKDALISLGHDMARYHQESFGAAAPVPVENLAANDTGGFTGEIYFENADIHHQCGQADTILLAAKAAGVSIPSGCTFGLCGTCKVKKTSGEVHMAHNGGISARDIEAGYILACCSRPLGKVSIQL